MIVLKATQDKVLAVLQSVAGIVERRHTLPILANVLIRKTGNALQFTTSLLRRDIAPDAVPELWELEAYRRAAALLRNEEQNYLRSLARSTCLQLLVPMAAGFPVPVTINEVVSQLHLARLQPGSSLAVKVGSTPQDVVIDWYRFGSPQAS